MNWPPLVAAFLVGVVLMLGAHRWLAARWMAGGMTPTRAAALTTAITFVPATLVLAIAGWITGRSVLLENWPIILVAIAAARPGFRAAIWRPSSTWSATASASIGPAARKDSHVAKASAMQPRRRPELPPDFLFRLWKTGMILAVGAVFFTVGCIAAVVFWPRSLVPAAVVIVGGALLGYIYRDRILSGRR